MRIGILGGGQLSRMLALAGYPLGLDFTFYEPNLTCSAEGLGKILHANYQDTQPLLDFADQVDVITYENENIPVETVNFLERYKPVFPGQAALKTSQDRLFEKQMFQMLNIATNEFMPIESKQDLGLAIERFGYPVLLKKRREGYDGKGQAKINNAFELEHFNNTELLTNTLVEQYVKFEREVSLIAVSSRSGGIQFYDISENVHENGILIRTMNKLNDPMFKLACEYLSKIIQHLNYIGTLAVEFFQVGDNLLANEMAPRVHNSGHWTIEGATASQFENHLRAIVDWPLGQTASLGYATMHNIIGTMPDKKAILKDPKNHLHDYQKSPRLGRKLGHITTILPF